MYNGSKNNNENHQNNLGVIRIPAKNNNNRFSNNNAYSNINNNGYSNQNNVNNNQNNGNDRNMVMRESRPVVKEIFIQTEINKTEVESL